MKTRGEAWMKLLRIFSSNAPVLIASSNDYYQNFKLPSVLFKERKKSTSFPIMLYCAKHMTALLEISHEQSHFGGLCHIPG